MAKTRDPQVLTYLITDLERSKNKLQKKIDEIQREADKVQKEIDRNVSLLQGCCEHGLTENVDTLRKGTYYNRGEYKTTTMCKLCGMILEVKTNDAGYG